MTNGVLPQAPQPELKCGDLKIGILFFVFKGLFIQLFDVFNVVIGVMLNHQERFSFGVGFDVDRLGVFTNRSLSIVWLEIYIKSNSAKNSIIKKILFSLI